MDEPASEDLDRLEVTVPLTDGALLAPTVPSFVFTLLAAGALITACFALTTFCAGQLWIGLGLLTASIGLLVATAALLSWMHPELATSDRIVLTRHRLTWRGRQVPLEQIADVMLYAKPPYLWVQLQDEVLAVPAGFRLDPVDAERLHDALRLRLSALARAEPREEARRRVQAVAQEPSKPLDETNREN